MNRFTQRVERDLSQIADRATPSSTAWEAIQQRIDEQDTQPNSEPTMEVIMLSPDRNEPPTRSRTWMLIAASVAAVALVGGLIVAANRDSDTVPADEPTVTVPDTPGVDGETAPAPAPAPAPDAEATIDPDTPIDEAGEALPPVELETRGVLNGTCEFGEFKGNPDGSQTAPQTCLIDGDPLPVQAQARTSLTTFGSNSTIETLAPGLLFVSTSDDGHISAGYTYNEDMNVRVVGAQPGAGAYEGETIRQLTRSGDNSNLISEWSTDVDDAPLPSTEEGGISAEVTIACSAEFVRGRDTEQILDQSCTYSSDDPRFDRAPDVIRVRIFPADIRATTLAEYPLFVTGETEDGYLFSGIAEDTTTVRGVGVRPGAGEFEGMLVHDVAHLQTATDGSLTGTIRSTVWPEG